MPTYDQSAAFRQEFKALNRADRRRFLAVLEEFRSDLRRGPSGLRPSLRVKRVVTHPGLWEMSWAPDGRATFSYGDEVVPGQPHVIWRRVGTHDIFQDP